MKIAVIGAGIFGATISFKLAEKYSVDLFEKNDDILKSASDVNQCRVHRGYHYPRSDATVEELHEAENSFNEEFSDAIMKNTENYYCIAKKDSLTTADEYLKFCTRHKLEYKISDLDVIDKKNIDLCVKVKENLFDHRKLKEICWRKMKKNNVNVHLRNQVDEKIVDNYDLVIVCTYADTNKFLKSFPKFQQEFQFEICEKIFVRLSNRFQNKSILIMDGPFMGIDPVGQTGTFIIGDVIHTVCHRNVGKYPDIKPEFLPLLDKGMIKDPPITNFKSFIESGCRFMPDLKKSIHVGSSFCIKTVLPHSDRTDERPSIVRTINDKVITVFSGKIPTCVQVANKIVANVERSKT